MRTLIDIPDRDVKVLDHLSQERGVSRARIVRMAIGEYLLRYQGDGADKAFGLWSGLAEDGVDYQMRLRSEW